MRKAADDSLPFINIQLYAADKLLTESREPHHTCFFLFVFLVNGVFLLTCPLSANPACRSFGPRRGDDALIIYAESRGAAQPPALVSSASLTGPLLFLSHQFTDNDTHTRARRRGCAASSHCAHCSATMVAPRHWNELLSKCARTF